MNKLIALILGGLVTFSAQADKGWCGYKDFFHLDERTRPLLFITNATTNGDVILQMIGPRSFELIDTERCRTGRAHVLITDYENANQGCVVDIEDGPFLDTPKVMASCNGIHFAGLTYDGIGSYSYTLKFQ